MKKKKKKKEGFFCVFFFLFDLFNCFFFRLFLILKKLSLVPTIQISPRGSVFLITLMYRNQSHFG